MSAALVAFGAAPGPGTGRALVCVPHAGGSVVAFRGWAAAAGATGMTVSAVHWDEEDAGSRGIEERADALAGALGTLPDRYVLLGHSLGALTAAETVRRLERDPAARLPERLVLCAAAPPGYPRGFPPGVRTAADASMREYARQLGGTPESILTDPEFGPEVLTRLRDDLDLIERYRPVFDPPLRTPVSIYGGIDDPVVTRDFLSGWQRLAPRTRIRMFAGGHFFLHDRPDDICRSVVTDCGHSDRAPSGA
ncbi:thioesterase II family protein [Actinoplanes sp. HUAS TT8]|uniref:thioesterase II family protein n=1 Tax=Actinoplanes sp. HUAS TT8 TaxID=3447453 RepID=UPI003F5256CB